MERYIVILLLLVLVPSSLMPAHAQIRNDPLYSRVLDAELTIKEQEEDFPSYETAFNWSIEAWNQNNETISLPSCLLSLSVTDSNHSTTDDCVNNGMELQPGLTTMSFNKFSWDENFSEWIQLNLSADPSQGVKIGGTYNSLVSGIKVPTPDEPFSSASNITYDESPENWGEILGDSGLPIYFRLQNVSYITWYLYYYEVSAEVEFYNPLSRTAEVTTPNVGLGHISVNALTQGKESPIFELWESWLTAGTIHEFKPGAVVKTMRNHGVIKNYTKSIGENITYLIFFFVDGQPSDHSLPLAIIVNGDSVTKIVTTYSFKTYDYSSDVTTTESSVVAIGSSVTTIGSSNVGEYVLNFATLPVFLAVMTLFVAKRKRRH